MALCDQTLLGLKTLLAKSSSIFAFSSIHLVVREETESEKILLRNVCKCCENLLTLHVENVMNEHYRECKNLQQSKCCEGNEAIKR